MFSRCQRVLIYYCLLGLSPIAHSFNNDPVSEPLPPTSCEAEISSPLPTESLVENPFRYEFLEDLGEGKIGILQKVRDLKNGDTFALKLPFGESESDLKDSTYNIKREATIYDQLSYEKTSFLLKSHGMVLLENGLKALKLEYFEGQDLDKYFQARQAEVTFYNYGEHLDNLLRIVSEMLMAIQDLHQQKILHLDIKPRNFLIGPHGEIKLVDLGLAAIPLAAPNKFGQWYNQTSHSEYYAPQEQVNYGTVGYLSYATDYFALGRSLYDILKSHLQLPPAPRIQSQQHDELLKKWQQRRALIDSFLIEPLTQTDQFDRLQTVDAFLEAVEKCR